MHVYLFETNSLLDTKTPLMKSYLQFLPTVCIAIGIFLISPLGLSQTLNTNDSLRFELVENCLDQNPSCNIKINAIGLFSKQSGQDFSQFIKELPTHKGRVIVHFSSMGGNLAGAIKVGQLLREYEFITQTGFMESVCYSACAYAFMGGSIRELGPQAKLGLHQFYSKSNDLNASSSQSVSAMLSVYLDLMGIDKKTLQLALSTQPNKITIVSKTQAQQLLIDNSLQPYQSWRLETTDTGQLAIITTERQANRPWTVTLVITKIQGQHRLMVQLQQHDKQQNANIIETLNTQPSLILGNQTQSLVTISPWQSPRPGVLQRWCLLNTQIVQQLSNPDAEMSLALDLPSEVLQQLRIKPITRLGKKHLNKYLIALNKN